MKRWRQVPGEEVTSAWNWADVKVRGQSPECSHLCVSVSGGGRCSEQDWPITKPSCTSPQDPRRLKPPWLTVHTIRPTVLARTWAELMLPILT